MYFVTEPHTLLRIGLEITLDKSGREVGSGGGGGGGPGGGGGGKIQNLFYNTSSRG